jgi:hypothetical protein
MARRSVRAARRRGCDFCEEAMAPLWQAWPIHKTAGVHATSRCRAATLQLFRDISTLTKGRCRKPKRWVPSRF